MEITKVNELTSDMATTVERLQNEIDRVETPKPVFEDIRNMRRSLNALERELRDEPVTFRGDAC